jgi:hypothetical protein
MAWDPTCSRPAGPLLRLKQTYAAAGLCLVDDELADHLAMVLEFAAASDPDAGRRLLLDHRAGLELLRLALRDTRSPWVHALDSVSATLPPLAGPTSSTAAATPPRRPRPAPRAQAGNAWDEKHAVDPRHAMNSSPRPFGPLNRAGRHWLAVRNPLRLTAWPSRNGSLVRPALSVL